MQKEMAILFGISITVIALSRFYKNVQQDRYQSNREKLNQINIFECAYLISFALLSIYVYWNRYENHLPLWYFSLRDAWLIQLIGYLLLSKVVKDKRLSLRSILKTPLTTDERKLP